jgi:hypothetical protein
MPGYTPPVTYHGGAVVSHMTVQAVYWQPPGRTFAAGYRGGIDGFLTDFAAADRQSANVLGVVHQYVGPSGPALVTLAVAPSLVDRDRLPARGCALDAQDTACVTDLQTDDELSRFITVRHLSTALDHAYVVLTPPGVRVCYAEVTGQCSGTQFCGFHNAVAAGAIVTPINFAVVPIHSECVAPGPQTATVNQAIQSTAHELLEMATDPLVDLGYVDKHGGEVIDECYGDFGTERFTSRGDPYNQVLSGHRYLLQEVWSDQQSTCRTSAQGAATARIAVPGVLPVRQSRRATVTLSGDPLAVRSIRWRWVPAGGGPTTLAGQGPSVTLRFPAPGRYVVWVTVIDAAGHQTTGVRSVTATAN